ncbi:hypothetical protein T10_2558 [Trichinella papuae]|uniref:Uncharacterized protein n=1 Tax=Trichinella papuae TaxID=268474 RepID=A0A0V1M4P7_9BILA|nr:hypothetical protein T10_2558 [Trichinella papuae]
MLISSKFKLIVQKDDKNSLMTSSLVKQPYKFLPKTTEFTPISRFEAEFILLLHFVQFGPGSCFTFI